MLKPFENALRYAFIECLGNKYFRLFTDLYKMQPSEEKANEILHLYLADIGKIREPEQHFVIIMKDDLTSYVCIPPLISVNAVATEYCLLK